MASWTSLGHGMRRRTGAPSNHLESAGKSMARNHMTSDEAYQVAAKSGSSRIPVGATAGTKGNPMAEATLSSVDEMTPGQMQGTLVPKKSGKSVDPTNPGSKQNRQNVYKVGATYRIQAKSTFVELDPAAGPTMANARIIPSIQGRVNPNFDSGEQDSYR